MLAYTQECWGNRAHGKKCFILFFPCFFFFPSLTFYFEFGFHLSLQINSFFLQVWTFVWGPREICLSMRPRKEGQRSGELEWNEGVQGQSEGDGLAQSAGGWRIDPGGETVLPQRERGRKRSCLSLNGHCANILFCLPSLIPTSLLSKTVFWDVSQ